MRYRVSQNGRVYDLVGKWQRDLKEADRLNTNLVWAANAGLEVPRHLGFEPSLGLVLNQMAEGAELRYLVPGHDARPFAAAGRWLDSRHSLPVPEFQAGKSIDHELDKIAAWAGQVAEKLPSLLQDLQWSQAALTGAASAFFDQPIVPIHRDFYPANLVWDGSRIRALDFDQMARGDPGVDIGAFLAQMDKLAIRDGLHAADVQTHQQAFPEVGLQETSISLQPRLPFFRSYTLIKLAAGEVRRERPDWQALTQRYVARARQHAELLPA